MPGLSAFSVDLACRAADDGGMNDAANARREPCIRCGDETAAGSRLFPGRRAIPDVGSENATVHLCGHCQEDVHRMRKVAHLSDSELRRLIDEGAIAGQTYAGMSNLTGFDGPT